ncbi:hypothetical protein DH09_00465 (plasmid) [Bacillaceae bacterium JMAK1]|nr:hypothetical protein DH09_00465 [Bacillaceae bacterium JMAK1]
MANAIKLVFLLLIVLSFSMFSVSFAQVNIQDQDNSTALHRATDAAMTEAVQYGRARVSEEVTIDVGVAETALRDHYSDSTGSGGDKTLRIHSIQSQPAFISAEAVTTDSTAIGRLLTATTASDQEEGTTRSRHTMIYEAK